VPPGGFNVGYIYDTNAPNNQPGVTFGATGASAWSTTNLSGWDFRYTTFRSFNLVDGFGAPQPLLDRQLSEEELQELLDKQFPESRKAIGPTFSYSNSTREDVSYLQSTAFQGVGS
jgi:hypothetical protein